MAISGLPFGQHVTLDDLKTILCPVLTRNQLVLVENELWGPQIEITPSQIFTELGFGIILGDLMLISDLALGIRIILSPQKPYPVQY